MVAIILDSTSARASVAPDSVLSPPLRRLSDVGDGWRALLLGAPPTLL
jgi:hypothetical protein